MNIVSILENVSYGETSPATSVLINTPDVKEVRIVFRAGQEMKEHKAGYPIVVAIIEGAIDFGIASERHLLQKGMLIALDANIPHDLKAVEDSIVRLSLNKADNIERARQATQV